MYFEYLFKREHSVYRKNKALWKRSSEAYSGGADYIEKALIKNKTNRNIASEVNDIASKESGLFNKISESFSFSISIIF